jgi:acyl-CoA thioester hydrolase
VGEPFRHLLRVRYGECDLQGVVFNAHYLAYFDTSINELLRAACGSYRSIIEQGIDVVVAEAQLRFRSAARFEDELALEATITRLGTTSIATAHRISRDGELLVEGTLRHVLVDLASMAKTPIPEWLRAQLEPWTVAAG